MSTEVRTETSTTQGVNGSTAGPTTQQTPGRTATPRQKRMLGWGLLTLALLMAYLLLVFWPEEFIKNANGISVDADGRPVTGSTRQTVYLVGDLVKFSMRLDVRLILMVMMAGGLGSFIHAATSFSDYVGNEKLTTNWLWWYVHRPFIGMMLAVVFYLAIRGGFLTGGGDAGSINPFGVAALAGLVGMFSKQATDKLSEVFDTLFKTSAGDSKRKDDLHNPVPVLTDIEPTSKEPKTDNLVVTVKGTGFVRGAAVRVNGVGRETEFIEATQLTAKLLPDDVANEGELVVTVFNPGPGGGTSTPIKLKIATGTPPPTPPQPGGDAVTGNGNKPPTPPEDAGAPAEEEGEVAAEGAVMADPEAEVRPGDRDS